MITIFLSLFFINASCPRGTFFPWEEEDSVDFDQDYVRIRQLCVDTVHWDVSKDTCFLSRCIPDTGAGFYLFNDSLMMNGDIYMRASKYLIFHNTATEKIRFMGDNALIYSIGTESDGTTKNLYIIIPRDDSLMFYVGGYSADSLRWVMDSSRFMPGDSCRYHIGSRSAPVGSLYANWADFDGNACLHKHDLDSVRWLYVDSVGVDHPGTRIWFEDGIEHTDSMCVDTFIHFKWDSLSDSLYPIILETSTCVGTDEETGLILLRYGDKYNGSTGGVLKIDVGGDGPGINVVPHDGNTAERGIRVSESGSSNFMSTWGTTYGYVSAYDKIGFAIDGYAQLYGFQANCPYFANYDYGAGMHIDVNAGPFDKNRRTGCGLHIRNRGAHYDTTIVGRLKKPSILVTADSSNIYNWLTMSVDSTDTTSWIRQDGKMFLPGGLKAINGYGTLSQVLASGTDDSIFWTSLTSLPLDCDSVKACLDSSWEEIDVDSLDAFQGTRIYVKDSLVSVKKATFKEDISLSDNDIDSIGMIRFKQATGIKANWYEPMGGDSLWVTGLRADGTAWYTKVPLSQGIHFYFGGTTSDSGIQIEKTRLRHRHAADSFYVGDRSHLVDSVYAKHVSGVANSYTFAGENGISCYDTIVDVGDSCDITSKFSRADSFVFIEFKPLKANNGYAAFQEWYPPLEFKSLDSIWVVYKGLCPCSLEVDISVPGGGGHVYDGAQILATSWDTLIIPNDSLSALSAGERLEIEFKVASDKADSTLFLGWRRFFWTR